MVAPKKPKLLFVATEDWFFSSHFLPLATAAIANGMDVLLAARTGDARASIERCGIRVIAVDADRAARGPISTLALLLALFRLFRAERPDITHLIALKPVFIGGLAARAAGVDRRIYAITGRGWLGASRSWRAGAVLAFLRTAIRLVLDGAKVRYLFENTDDAQDFAPAKAKDSRVSIVGGAGVDIDELRFTPMPTSSPLRVAIVGRMLWQKGIDIAIEAAQAARRQGTPVELSLFGLPDEANPDSFTVEQLREWSGITGVKWFGKTNDVRDVWRTHHACCVPSRGGEGLPRALLEAAACGRAIVTTDVPGCRSFVRSGTEGIVAPAENAEALARAFVELASDPAKLAAMGVAARERVAEGYTTQAVAAAVLRLYREMLSEHD
jgi:glycosyltransferase involved in cell wall biosynthesis